MLILKEVSKKNKSRKVTSSWGRKLNDSRSIEYNKNRVVHVKKNGAGVQRRKKHI
jgi:hypothetical protein